MDCVNDVYIRDLCHLVGDGMTTHFGKIIAMADVVTGDRQR